MAEMHRGRAQARQLNTMRDDLVVSVEQLTDRRVIAIVSDNHPDRT